MKKHKLLTPAGILGIIGSSYALLCGLIVMLNLSAYSSTYLAPFILAILLFLTGVFGVTICSVALGANKKKTYSINGRQLCIASLVANACLLALDFIEIVVMRTSEFIVAGLIYYDLYISFILCLLALIFYGVGVSKSIPGTIEEINAVLMASNASVMLTSQIEKNEVSHTDDNEDLIATLERLHNLYQNGVLTKEEYEEKKKVILEKL